jgi:hypothetical protein
VSCGAGMVYLERSYLSSRANIHPIRNPLLSANLEIDCRCVEPNEILNVRSFVHSVC